jgi:hypothetical protein
MHVAEALDTFELFNSFVRVDASSNVCECSFALETDALEIDELFDEFDLTEAES